MKVYIEPIGKLINEFSKLPGVGAKTAQRFAYKIINMTDAEAQNFATAILDVKKKVKYCKICGNFSEEDECDICKRRSAETICVVKEPKDVIAIEKLNEYNDDENIDPVTLFALLFDLICVHSCCPPKVVFFADIRALFRILLQLRRKARSHL